MVPQYARLIENGFDDEYDAYVFDTAPTANARRLLGMSSVYGMWVNKMMQSREEAKSLKEVLSYSKKEEKDPLMDYLVNLRTRMDRAKELLTDDEKTAFFFITLPEALPIAVIKRFIGWFYEFNIPVGGIVVNLLIDKEAIGEDAPDFVLNRIAMQDSYMKDIWQSFPDVRAVIPLFDNEVRGIEMLELTAKHLFA